MLAFIKEKTRLGYLIALIISLLIPQILFVSTNPFTLFWGFIPLLVIFMLGFDIRSQMETGKKVSFWNYLGSFWLSSFLVGLTLLPIAIVINIITLSIMKFDPMNAAQAPFSWITILFSFFISVPLQLYSIGCLVQSLGDLKGTFDIRKSFQIIIRGSFESTLAIVAISSAIPYSLNIIIKLLPQYSTFASRVFLFIMFIPYIIYTYLTMKLIYVEKNSTTGEPEEAI